MIEKILREYAEEINVLNRKTIIKNRVQEQLINELAYNERILNKLMDYEVTVYEDAVEVCLILEIESSDIDEVYNFVQDLSEDGKTNLIEKESYVLFYFIWGGSI